MEASPADVRCRPVQPCDVPTALRLVFKRMPAPQRDRQVDAMLAAAHCEGDLRVEGLWGAYRRDRLVAAVLAEVHPGKTAVVWPPRIVDAESQETATRLVGACCDWLAGVDVCLAQTLLRSGTSPDARLLLSGGFVRLAKLYFLMSPEGEFPESPPAGSLEFEPVTPESEDRLAALVEATYAQTLDCPALNGVRPIEDVLAGYRATGTFDPRWWLIACRGSRDVGCLLLADHPEDGNVELVYMGLVASARGEGWGVAIARQAQWMARQAGRSRLVLAVDAENRPAMNAYSRVGFRAWDRRIAYVKVLGEHEAKP